MSIMSNIYNDIIRPAVAYDYTRMISRYQSASKSKKYICMGRAICKNLPKIIKNSRTNKGCVIPQVELIVTTGCSLRCKNCSQLMPLYGAKTRFPYMTDIEMNKKAITNLLEAVDRVNTFHILGGEPFLYKDLKYLVNFLGKKENIGQIEITTNGTILPDDDEFYRILSENRVIVHMSNYGKLSKKIPELKERFAKNNVVYRELFLDSDWIDPGNEKKRGRSVDELKRQFANCATECRGILNGKIHRCSRSAHLMDLSIMEDKPEEYVDLLDEQLNTLERRKKIIDVLLNSEWIEACDYCDFGIEPVIWVRPGEQISNKE